MICEYCHGEGFHYAGCPLYEEQNPIHHCSICHEGIYNGEEYVVNDDGDYRHYDCFYGMRDLLEWLGYKINTMGDDFK